MSESKPITIVIPQKELIMLIALLRFSSEPVGYDCWAPGMTAIACGYFADTLTEELLKE